MKKYGHLLAALAVAGLLTAPAYAEPAKGAPKTRQEAITRAKEYVAKLEKMSDAEWTQFHEKRKAERRGTKGAKAKKAPAAAPAKQ